ncbi:hypothetical protein SAMN05216338_103073 [Bradyrhizobium sp. Rc2d]|nr:hypothetical protein SAMN05216338_103073 [Bradyrhizobium sp. Rc2d]
MVHAPRTTVMAGLDPAIHVHPRLAQDVDARGKPGHDELREPRALYPLILRSLQSKRLEG